MKAFLEKINQELDQARSFLARHGGDIEVVAFDEKTGCLKLRFRGACAGCPAAQLTYEKLIVGQLSSLPEIKEIKLVV